MSVQKYRVVLPVKKKEKLKFSRNAAVMLVVFALYCFVNVWQNVYITHLTRRNEALRRELQEITRRCDMLAFELDQLKDPDHVKAALQGVTKLVPAETKVIKKGGRRR